MVRKWNPNYSAAPVIGSAVNESALTKTETTDYVGNIVYETGSDGTVKSRILIDGGYIENGVYHFYVTDHLGSVRLVVNQSGTVVQKNHYYPFGLSFAEGLDREKQPYKYTGKELDMKQGAQLYDYSARYYDPTIGRFTTVDPLAEKYYSVSPYAYCMNNPVKYIDSTGEEIWVYYMDENGKEQKMMYNAGEKYSGKNEFVSNTFLFLNGVYENGGSKMMDKLISSSNTFNFINQYPTDRSGNPIQAMEFEESKTGGGNIYAASLMDKRSSYSKVESTAHELLHGLQYELGQGGASVVNEMGAFVYSSIIATKWSERKSDFGGALSSNGLGQATLKGKIYQASFEKLVGSYDQMLFKTAVENFKEGASKNTSGLYNKLPLRLKNQKKSILYQYYPR